MKKLSKIKLQNAVVLENSEMKVIYGGSGGFGGSGSTCSGGGLNNPVCEGECSPTAVWDPINKVFVPKDRNCNATTNSGTDGSTLTVCSCS